MFWHAAVLSVHQWRYEVLREKYHMYEAEKSRLFADDDAFRHVLGTAGPRLQVYSGRGVRGFETDFRDLELEQRPIWHGFSQAGGTGPGWGLVFQSGLALPMICFKIPKTRPVIFF